MRPTQRHIAISPQSGLYAMPSLCVLTATPGVVPSFRWLFFIDLSPSETPGVPRLPIPSSFAEDAGLRPDGRVSALPTSSHSDSREGAISGLPYRSLALRPVDLLALLSELTGSSPADKDLYFRASDGLVTRSAAGYNYRGNWASSPGRTSTC